MIENFIGVGERLSSKLNELGLKQVDVSAATDISKNAMSNYISGKRIPNTLEIYKLSKCLSVTIEWLLTGEEEEYIIEATSTTEAEVFHKVRQLTEQEQLKLIGYVDAMQQAHNDHLKRTESSRSTSGEEAATTETA